jgi:uncharacterized protein with HEPN domain
MRNKRDNLAYLKNIRDAIDKIVSYSKLHTYEEFSGSQWDQFAVMRYFEVIGEATNNIDNEFKRQHPEIKWVNMVDFRNFLIHDYLDVDINIVWKTMKEDIVPINEQIEEILNK